MHTKLSVLIPTRGRLDRLQVLLDSYERTTRGVGQTSELVFRVDEDDAPTHHFLDCHRHNFLIGPRHKGYESLPVFFNELAAAAKGDVLMCGNDDMVFQTEHWAPKILAVADSYPDGIFDIGVNTHNETHYPFATVSRVVVEKLGFLFDPRIFWGDIYLRDVMICLGRTVMVPEVQIDHDWAGHNPDQVFNEGEGARRACWMSRHGEAVSDAVIKLKELVQ